MIFHVFDLLVRHDVPTGSYLVGDRLSREVMWVDPAVYDTEIIRTIKENQYNLVAVAVTHTHYDHVGGISEVMDEWGVPVYIHRVDSSVFGRKAKAVKDSDIFHLGRIQVIVHETPGHTPGGISFLVGNKYAFTGDALFAGSVGGTYGESDFKSQIKAIKDNIFSLKDDVIVCPGHGPLSTVGIERVYNPFFQ
jgi:glyoxylase-like metal-dependent hydrolase (beta-lactamase superfamily II)